MRIGMMVDVYKPHISGVTNYITLNKRYLEEAGHEVFVFTFGDEDYQDDEINVIRSPGVPLMDTGFYLNVRYSPQARKILSTMNVVHVHHPFLSGSLSRLYCTRRGIPVLFTNHTRYDLYARAYLPMLPHGVSETFLKTYLPEFCQEVDYVIAPSPGMKKVLEQFGVDVPIEVVPNGVDIKPYQHVSDPIQRSELGFSQDDILLVYSGRLGPEKNLPFLLRAVNGAVQAFDNIKLLIIGDGTERDNLEDRVHHMGIEQAIHFTGMVPYLQIPRYLAAADIFVTASVTEVHPLSVIEAMATGLPVLGILSPGVGDTIQDGDNGFLVKDEDLAAFTAKLIRLATDQELRRSMSAQARQNSQKYAIEGTTQKLLEIYERLAGDSRGRKRSLKARLYRFFDNWRL
ncbi:MAG: glycosyltransferase [Anaerolineales bacterium]|nr:glycosyltransferase [Anaerolineales bacterium]